MAENSKIEWTHHTFNPWWGCAKVSPGCDNCYAERDAGRFTPDATLWGVDAGRREFGEKHWNEPRKWDAKAAKEGKRYRVFCASMADVFDKNAPAGARERLWTLIEQTPNIDWLILTKRIGNARHMIPDRWSVSLPPNVWLGISVVNQEEADRDIPKLLALKAHVRWLSMEPLLGPVDLSKFMWQDLNGNFVPQAGRMPRIDWVVVGGESGPNARPMHSEWPRKLRDQCTAAGVPFLFKQWGEWAPAEKRGDQLVITGETDFTNAPKWHEFDDGQVMARIGKKAAGRQLDGSLHDGYPQGAVHA